MSSIFETILDAFKLDRFQPNFKYSFLRSYADHPKRHQGHQPQSGMSIIIIDSSNTCNNVINLWGWSWCLQLNRFQQNFKLNLLRAYADHPKHHQGHQPQSEMTIIIIDSRNKLNRFQPNFKLSFLMAWLKSFIIFWWQKLLKIYCLFEVAM